MCGVDVNLTYPQNGIITPLKEIPGGSEAAKSKLTQLARRSYPIENSLAKRDRDNARELWKRNLSGRGNGSIDAWVGCFLLESRNKFDSQTVRL